MLCRQMYLSTKPELVIFLNTVSHKTIMIVFIQTGKECKSEFREVSLNIMLKNASSISLFNAFQTSANPFETAQTSRPVPGTGVNFFGNIQQQPNASTTNPQVPQVPVSLKDLDNELSLQQAYGLRPQYQEVVNSEIIRTQDELRLLSYSSSAGNPLAEEMANRRRERVESLKATENFLWEVGYQASSLENRLYDASNLAINHAWRNQHDLGSHMLHWMYQMITSTSSDLMGSAPQNADSFATTLAQLWFNHLEGTARSRYLGVQGIQPSDADLLRLTGYDSQGRDYNEFRQAQLADIKLTNTSTNTLRSELANLPKSSNLPGQVQLMQDRLTQQDGKPLMA
jgi:hypothetical protein